VNEGNIGGKGGEMTCGWRKLHNVFFLSCAVGQMPLGFRNGGEQYGRLDSLHERNGKWQSEREEIKSPHSRHKHIMCNTLLNEP
jgi:hypothetical protein